jgi:hypothetical protein
VIAPRIIPRDTLGPTIRHPRAVLPQRTCRATIELGGTVYRCGRETTGVDADRGLGAHAGIHDAFCEHQGGAVRW